MPPPSLWMQVRHVLGRAFRETGQALNRVGIRGAQHATTERLYGDDPYIFDDHLSRHRHLFPLLRRGGPIVSPDAAFLAPCSTLIGTVRVESGASIWYGAILRADQCENGSILYNNQQEEEINNTTELDFQTRQSNILFELDPDRHETQENTDLNVGGGIYIGENSNIQDGCIITSNTNHAWIGKGVTVGHLAQIHSATVHDYSLIGMGAILKDNVVVHSESLVAAGAVVTSGTIIGKGELWVGHPAKKIRMLTPEERTKLHYQSNEYVKVAKGQSGVMQLGGNIADWKQLLDPALPTGDENKAESIQNDDATKVDTIRKEEEEESSSDDKIRNDERIEQQVHAETQESFEKSGRRQYQE